MESLSLAERLSAPDVGQTDPFSMGASSTPTGPKSPMSAGSELEVAAEDLQPEGPARKRPRRDVDGVATCTNVVVNEDDLLCDWIGALAWLETAATTAQVRRLRELAAALDKEPVTCVGLKDAAQYFQV